MYGSWGYNPRDAASPFDQNGMLIDRPAQHRGGMSGRVARWFWGTPTPPGERPHKLHIPLAGDIAATSADLLFGEMPKLAVDDAKTQDQLQELIELGVHASLLEAAELCAAQGGVYLRVAWDRAIAPAPWLSSANADAAIPEWRWNKLSAVTFWEVLEGPGVAGGRPSTTVVRHLERHEPGRILHGLYEGTADKLGRPVPLTDHAATAALAGIVDEHSAIATGIEQLTVVYVPNMRPNRIWRADPATVNFGRSDYSGVEGPMDALDEVWTSWMRDIRLGKARLLVPDMYLQNLGPGKGAVFDADREVFTGLTMLPKPDGGSGSMITENQFTIRWQEHKATVDELFGVIVRDSGYSMQTFGESADVRGVTATEINARQRKTMTTRGRKTGYWRPELGAIVEAQLAIWAQLAPELGIQPQRPKIEWPDVVQADPQVTATTIQLLHAAEAISQQTAVQMANPDWDEQQVADEVARIRADMAVAQPPMPDPASITGL